MAIIYLGWAQALACSSCTWFVLGEGSHNTKPNCRLGDKLPFFKGAPELEALIKRHCVWWQRVVGLRIFSRRYSGNRTEGCHLHGSTLIVRRSRRGSWSKSPSRLLHYAPSWHSAMGKIHIWASYELLCTSRWCILHLVAKRLLKLVRSGICYNYIEFKEFDDRTIVCKHSR